jgi:proline dehydrogenase
MLAHRGMRLARATGRLHYRRPPPTAAFSSVVRTRRPRCRITHALCNCHGESCRCAAVASLPYTRRPFHAARPSSKGVTAALPDDDEVLNTSRRRPLDATATSSQAKNPIPDFSNAHAAYAHQSTAALYRSLLTFSICQVPLLVRHAEPLLSVTRRLLGDTWTDRLLQMTLFGHFCAGTNRETMHPAITTLEQAGIGSILDFAAEDDGETADSAPKLPPTQARLVMDTLPIPESEERKLTNSRVYDYQSEAQCDQHVEDFVQCIRDVAALGKDGYAAVKVTALGSPDLLKRMSTAIYEAKQLFAKFDVNGDGLIEEDEFEEGYRQYFTNDESAIRELKEQLRCAKTGRLDYITWSMTLTPRDLPRITKACREEGPLSLATPTKEEIVLIERMYERGRTLAEEAAAHGTRLLIDAEQVRFQPAIDNLVLDLQQTYNSTDMTDFPLIYNTYQCYLRDSLDRLRLDVERSERYDYHFGAKMVRGAYLENERLLAEERSYPDPIHETIEETHNCYNEAVDMLLEHAAAQNGKHTEIMMATHNQESLEKAIASMNIHGIDRRAATTAFGQLYGMADNLSFNLGKHGYVVSLEGCFKQIAAVGRIPSSHFVSIHPFHSYRAYKYVPYGEVKMVMPYLIRRANENSSVSKGAQAELGMLYSELSRRRFGLA